MVGPGQRSQSRLRPSGAPRDRQLSRFVDDPAAELRVELGRVNASKGGAETKCHLTLRLSGSRVLQVEETTADADASLDLAAERLVRVVKEEVAR